MPRFMLLVELALAVALSETLDSASGIHELLLAGEEGVTDVADLQTQLLLGGVGLERVATRTDSGDQMQLKDLEVE